MELIYIGKKIIFLMIIGSLLACVNEEEEIYTENAIEYSLVAGSDYEFDGVVTIRELRTGELEVGMVLNGPPSTETYLYPAHLHFGSYDSPNAPMAQMLTPIDARTLQSKTIIAHLHDGSNMDFERLINFDGHIKVHLAEDGPDYNTILVIGNIGANAKRTVKIDKMTICSPYSFEY